MAAELPIRTFSGVERAAVLMMLVGEDEAAAILQKLEPEEVRQLGSAMFKVADVSEAEVARVLRAKWALGLAGGVMLANPIPEADEIPAADMAPNIERALADMDALGLTGKDTTPYLLGRIVEITGGRSLATNIALVRHNAAVAARVAAEYAALARA